MRPCRRRAGGRRRGITSLRRVAAALAALLVLVAPVAGQDAGPRMLERDSVRVVYWPENRGAAERTLDAATRPFPMPGLPVPARPFAGTIVLAPDAAAFDSLTGGRAPGWSAGVAIPGRRLIILPAYRAARGAIGDPETTLRHEIAHLALNDYLDVRIPRWFDEGYATWVSGSWDESAGWQIRLALLRREAPALDSLSLAWPAGQERARLAYLLSASAVRHLAVRSGEPAFAALLASWRELGTLDAALRATYQMTLWQYELEWREMVRRRYGWLLALSQGGVFWVVITVLLLVLGIPRRRRQREKLAQLELEDRMLPPPSEPLEPLDPTDPGVDEESAPG